MTATTSLSPFPPLPQANQAKPNQASPPSEPAAFTDPNSTLAAATLSHAPASAGPPTPTGSLAKEAAPKPIESSTQSVSETAPLVEISESEPLPAEVEGWLQKLDQEGDIHLPQPVTDDGQILLDRTPVQSVTPKIILPLTETGVEQGLKAKISDSAKWLANWCVRLLKMMQDQVKYAPETIKEVAPQQKELHD